jgi:hypothetical protein
VKEIDRLFQVAVPLATEEQLTDAEAKVEEWVTWLERHTAMRVGVRQVSQAR